MSQMLPQSYGHTDVAVLGETWKSLRLNERDHMEIYMVHFTLLYVQNLLVNLHRWLIYPAIALYHSKCKCAAP